MTSKITINVETDDAALAGRIAAAFRGAEYGHTDGDVQAVPSTGRPAVGEHAEQADRQDWSGHNDNGYAENPTSPTEEHEHQDGASGETAGPEPDTAGNSSAPRDQHGVAFNVHYCGEAQDPFYSSGKRSGQWKKKRGVSDKDYDDWYAEELAELRGGATDEESHQPAAVNTAGAFGNGQAQQQSAPAAPQDTGEFMGWVSEKQAGGHITQDDIQQAYNQAGVQVTDLFPPNDPQTIAGRIRQLYDLLAPKAGA